MSDGVKRQRECEVVGKAGWGCDGGEISAVGRAGGWECESVRLPAEPEWDYHAPQIVIHFFNSRTGQHVFNKSLQTNDFQTLVLEQSRARDRATRRIKICATSG